MSLRLNNLRLYNAVKDLAVHLKFLNSRKRRWNSAKFSNIKNTD